MFRSLKMKIFFLVLVILALVAVSILFFTKRDVEKAMLGAEERSALNIQHLVELTINGRFVSRMTQKVRAIEASKAMLTDRSVMVMPALAHFHELSASGRVTDGQARAMAFAWLDQLSFGEGEYIMIYDGDYRAVYYPDPDMIGKDLTSFRDLKGRVVVEAMREEAISYGGAFATYRWKGLHLNSAITKYGLFTYFPEWDWVVAFVGEVDDIEREMTMQLAEMTEVLNESIPQIRLTGSGYVFIFSGDGDVVIRPDHVERDLSNVRNLLTGELLQEELMAAAEDDDTGPVFFAREEENGKPVVMQAYASYFKGLDWYIVVAVSTEGIQKPARMLITRQALTLGGILLVSLFFGFILAMRMGKPLARLTDHAKELPKQDFTSMETAGEAIKHLPEQYKDEVGRLAEAFIFMEDSLKDNIRNLMDVTASKERIESELNIARDIQMGLLHKIFPAFPDRKEFDLYALLVSAKEVGGDLYDFFFLDRDHLCFSVGDVSDKGVPAALFMAITKTMIQASTASTESPAQMMRIINDKLSQDNPNSMFVTLFVGILNVKTGEVAFVNGGHNHPLVIRKEADEVEWVSELGGPIIGGFEGIEFKESSLVLAPGDALVLYTDGVTEAMNRNKDLFSDPRLMEVVTSMRHRSARELVTGIMGEIKEFVAGAPQSDDITLLTIRYRGVHNR